jgi:hypothetical protein
MPTVGLQKWAEFSERGRALQEGRVATTPKVPRAAAGHGNGRPGRVAGSRMPLLRQHRDHPALDLACCCTLLQRVTRLSACVAQDPQQFSGDAIRWSEGARSDETGISQCLWGAAPVRTSLAVQRAALFQAFAAPLSPVAAARARLALSDGHQSRPPRIAACLRLAHIQ